MNKPAHLFVALLGLSGLLPSLRAQSLLPYESVEFSNDSVTLRVAGQATSYYVLEGSTDLQSFAIRDAKLGLEGTISFSEGFDASRMFFRIGEIPLTSPHDSDGDGIDDIFELQHPDSLDAADPLDALLDFDNDGASNLGEYLNGSDHEVPTVVFISDAGGEWNVGANWNTGSVPGAGGAEVLIDLPEGMVVTHSSGTSKVSTLSSNTPINLTGGILEVSNPILLGAELALNGGTLKGTTVMPRAGGECLVIGANSNNLLDGVTINCDVTLAASGARFRVDNGLTLNGTIRMANTSTIGFMGDETVSGTGTLLFDPTTAGTKFLEMVEAGTLTIGSGITVEGARGRIGGGWQWARDCSVVNEGTIIANDAAGEIYVESRGGGSLTNNGRLEAVNDGDLRIRNLMGSLGDAIINTGGKLIIENGSYAVDQAINLTDANTSLALGGTYAIEQAINQSAPGTSLTLNGDWTNSSTVTLSDGALVLGGSFGLADLGTIVRTGGSVTLAGALDLEGGTLALTVATGSWRLDGGTLSNGTYTSDGTGVLEIRPNSGNLLDAMTVNGDLEMIDSGARFRVDNGLTLNGTIRMANTSTIGFMGDETVSGTGTLLFDPTTAGTKFLEMVEAGTLTIGSGITVEGARGRIGGGWQWARACSVINEGTIIADGGLIQIETSGGTYTEQGITQEINGGAIQIDHPAP